MVNSDFEPITYGVPQGSILGPLLFILFINDIVNCSPLLFFLLFADDTNLLLSGNSYEDILITLNPELVSLSEWFKANKLSLNVAKTNYVLFGSKAKRKSANNLCVLVDGKPIARVSETKFLGVIIDENLNWKSHAALISSKVAKNVGVINRIKHLLNKAALKTLYYSLIYSHLTYCILLWGNASINALHNIEVLQKRAIRAISGNGFLAHTNPICQTLRILKLRDIYIRDVSIFMFKLTRNLLPPCCDLLFT
jgi:hypothetical protein